MEKLNADLSQLVLDVTHAMARLSELENTPKQKGDGEVISIRFEAIGPSGLPTFRRLPHVITASVAAGYLLIDPHAVHAKRPERFDQSAFQPGLPKGI